MWARFEVVGCSPRGEIRDWFQKVRLKNGSSKEKRKREGEKPHPRQRKKSEDRLCFESSSWYWYSRTNPDFFPAADPVHRPPGQVGRCFLHHRLDRQPRAPTAQPRRDSRSDLRRGLVACLVGAEHSTLPGPPRSGGPCEIQRRDTSRRAQAQPPRPGRRNARLLPLGAGATS